VRQGAVPIMVLTNNTTVPLDLTDRCPLPPVDVLRASATGAFVPLAPVDAVVPCEPVQRVEPQKSEEYALGPWKTALFTETGSYRLVLTTTPSEGESGTGTVLSTDFVINEAGVFTRLFRAFISKPLLNALIFLGSVLPGYNLGFAIIVLTLVVKLILFLPTQQALEGQKKMQLLQPKIEAIRRQHKDDPVKLQQETMKMWKEHKINPFQSCLPLLVQFPVLIGLFYVVRDGVHLELSQHLLYPVYQNLSWTFDTSFLGLDLMRAYWWLFPPLLVVLQFLQMKLTFHIADKKKREELKKTTTPEIDTPQELQQKMMLYLLPLMIGFFAFTMPSAVSLYWGVSTVFAIVQQMIVNREHLTVKA
jgi:YidC/Oxa1 family membrane protein insertase